MKIDSRTARAPQLSELDQRSTEETARMMGISVQNVKSRLFRSRRKLRWLLVGAKSSPACGNDPLRRKLTLALGQQAA